MTTAEHMASIMEHAAQQLRAGRWRLSAVEVYEERDGAGVFVILRAGGGPAMATHTFTPWEFAYPQRWRDRLEQMQRALGHEGEPPRPHPRWT